MSVFVFPVHVTSSHLLWWNANHPASHSTCLFAKQNFRLQCIKGTSTNLGWIIHLVVIVNLSQICCSLFCRIFPHRCFISPWSEMEITVPMQYFTTDTCLFALHIQYEVGTLDPDGYVVAFGTSWCTVTGTNVHCSLVTMCDFVSWQSVSSDNSNLNVSMRLFFMWNLCCRNS